MQISEPVHRDSNAPEERHSKGSNGSKLFGLFTNPNLQASIAHHS